MKEPGYIDRIKLGETFMAGAARESKENRRFAQDQPEGKGYGMPTRVAVRDGPSMNPLITVGALRDPSGLSAWRSMAHQIYVEAGSLFIEYRFKKR